MALLKKEKKELAKKYLDSVKSAENVVLLSFEGIPVNEMNDVRMGLAEANGDLEVVKKKVFMKGIEGKLEGITLDEIDGPLALLYSNNEEDMHAPLKVINKYTKSWKKEKHEFGFGYIGGWYDQEWKGEKHVTQLANLPTKEELYGKFVFMLNHPVASFARVINAIAENQDVPDSEKSDEKSE